MNATPVPAAESNIVPLRLTLRTKAVLPVSQTMHLRLLDDDTGGAVSPVGGFTLAYRVTDSGRITASYAYAECSSMDNYCRAVGRRIATARLAGSAREFSGSFPIDLPTDGDRTAVVYKLDEQGTIDIAESTFEVRRAVLKHFLTTQLSALYQPDIDFESAVVWRGRLPFLNMEAIAYGCPPKDPAATLVQIHALAEKLRHSSTAVTTGLEAWRLVSEIIALSSGWAEPTI